MRKKIKHYEQEKEENKNKTRGKQTGKEIQIITLNTKLSKTKK